VQPRDRGDTGLLAPELGPEPLHTGLAAARLGQSLPVNVTAPERLIDNKQALIMGRGCFE